ncbi:MAG: hypothetical protein A2306_09430 [Omnitrophica WOR_2 bacterium RIFOXYB2_FULL_38_16]|nr:MAG: hypothetical protein A2243_08320 [Omnitrophica WOR_2 bacterium RIFOXYA2_FULL_38_17]OGX51435.1 MAG: hypothetical protein A2267_08480 [Omnitrophica WOR_2 bacterium RIFOXYA12_FULL_38_10]OGX56107.1 MAG: hypothetical protein A2447_07530 [Omnitrophica WOR_2 bacterium RIFOXYC2_FULL_38_12]OGX60457.1 MAG: hypothetical protein A2306_09430 [Omnitrophica WOR_2 bacterium RIFOXYB2_FULL_38_16]HBG60865.1 hypothetical protein [Candidatus Omnitrophota bacterium]
MRLAKLIKFMCLMTVLALIYIHIQMQITDFAYQGIKKDGRIKELIEENGNITYAVSTLKSANYLGLKMFNENSDMQYIDQDNIEQISTSEELDDVKIAVKKAGFNKVPDQLLSLLSFGSQAEAKQR